MQTGVIFGLLFAFIIALFAVMNTETVSVNYYFGRVETSAALLVLASAIFGALTVGFLGLVKQIAGGFTLWNYENQSKRLAKKAELLNAQKNALADDLSFLQAEYEEALRRREEEHQKALKPVVRGKEDELTQLVSTKQLAVTEEVPGNAVRGV